MPFSQSPISRGKKKRLLVFSELWLIYCSESRLGFRCSHWREIFLAGTRNYSPLAKHSTMSDSQEQDQDTEQHKYGVLLYYNYTLIPDLNDLVAFYESNCSSLGLLGRVRLSSHGVNVTVRPKSLCFSRCLENHGKV